MDPQILEKLELGNPWWTDPSAGIPHVKPVPREPFRKLLGLCFDFSPGVKKRAVILIGLRQVGKTVLARQLAKHALEYLGGTQIAILDVDDPRFTGNLTLADFIDVWETHRLKQKPALLVVDEIQKLASAGGGKDWARQLAGVVNRDQIRVLATGSAAGLLQERGADLAGRCDRILIEPLSFKEFRQLRAGESRAPRAEVRYEDREQYLSVGGFPEFASNRDVSGSLERIRAYVLDVLRADLSQFRQHAAIVRLFAILMDQSGEELNVAGLAGKLQVAQNTLKEWIDALEDVFLIHRVPRLESSMLRRIAGRPKVYAADPGLLAAFAPGSDPLAHPRVRARLFEAAVLRHLRELARRVRGEVVCVQEQGQRDEPLGEADFVLISDQGAFLIEVKSGFARQGRTELLSLARKVAKASHGKEVRCAIVHGGSTREGHSVSRIPLVDFLERVLEGEEIDPCSALRELTSPVA